MLVVPAAVEVRRRFPRLLFGLVVCGAGLAAMVRAELGLGPWEVLHQGISERTGVPIGTVGILVGVVVLVGWVPMRQPLGLGTITNAIVIGVVVDLVLAATSPPEALAVRWLCTIGGVVAFGVGSGFYIGAGLGPGPRDGLMTGIAARGHSIRAVRTGIELAALALGWILGGNVGVGTVLFALGIGPLVHVALPLLTIASGREVAASDGPAGAE